MSEDDRQDEAEEVIRKESRVFIIRRRRENVRRGDVRMRPSKEIPLVPFDKAVQQPAPAFETDGGGETFERWGGLRKAVVPGASALMLVLVALVVRYATRDDSGGGGTARVEGGAATGAAATVAGAKEAIASFAGAPDIASMLPLVRDPERVRPLMEDHYSRHPIEPAAVSEYGLMAETKLFGRQCVVATYATGSGQTSSIILEQTGGGLKVDWETFAVYGETGWGRFVAGRAGEATLFRCYATPDTYYAFDFEDRQRYSCVRLRHPYSDTILYGYVNANTPMGPFPLTPGDAGTEVPVILRLRYPEGARRPNQVIITEIYQRQWMWAPDEPK